MPREKSEEVFDIIIIGGGTAGSLLAARLSSDPSLRILVLEAGQNRNEDEKVRIPGLAGTVFGDPSYDWQFQTACEEGLNGRVIKQPRGRLWGGSSAINSHALVYPSRRYHDAWDTLLGSENVDSKVRWNWEGVREYYKRFSHVQEIDEEIREKLRIGKEVGNEKSIAAVGKGLLDNAQEATQNLQASFPVKAHILQEAWADTIQELGFNHLKDPVDGEVGGTTTTNAVDSFKGERSHAGAAFLEPMTKRENLVVRSNVLVKKVLFDEKRENGKLVARSVIYSEEHPEGEFSSHASKEVILCAGTFGTPKVLELSGIGRKESLASAGIECLYDLPGVGENLQDHLNFGPSVQVHDSIITADVAARDPAVAKADKQLYDSKHQGRLAEGAAYSFSHLPLSMTEDETEQRQLNELVEKLLQDTSTTTKTGQKAQYEIIQNMIRDQNEATATVFLTRKQRYTSSSQPAPGNYLTLLAMLSYPFSRGSSHIASANSNEKPEIKFNYLQHPLDSEILARHMIQIGEMLKLPTLSQHLQPQGITLPDQYPRFPTDVIEVVKYLRDFATTNYHPAGTSAMMREELDGVVDGYMKVYGTTNLRVCDASVIPILPRGNILTTVYALAEKAADLIKG